MAPPSNETLDVKTQYIMSEIKGIKENQKEHGKKIDGLSDTMNKFINKAEKEFLPRADANKMFAKKRVQDVAKRLAIAIGGGLLTVLGKALVFYLKNGDGSI